MTSRRKKSQQRSKSAKRVRSRIKYGSTSSDAARVIRSVRQQHDTGCAIACAAMLAGVSYKEALNAIHGGKKQPRVKSATIPKVRKGLRSLGVSTKETGRFMQLKQPAIMMFEWPCDPGLYHCVVYDPAFGGRIIDPADDGWSWQHRGRTFYLNAWRRSGRLSVVLQRRMKQGRAKKRCSAGS